jgi:hypothetical protein
MDNNYWNPLSNTPLQLKQRVVKKSKKKRTLFHYSLPSDIWQYLIIDYLEYDDQAKLVKTIPKLELTNLIGIKHITDNILLKMRYVKWLDASWKQEITNKGIKHQPLHTLYASYKNSGYDPRNMTDMGIKDMMSLRVLDKSGNKDVTDIGIQSLTLHTLYIKGYDCKITDEGIRGMTSLRSLNIENNGKITDYGLEYLSLHTLNINDQTYGGTISNITDKGIRGMTSLRSLNIGGSSKITDYGLNYKRSNMC